MKLKITLLFAIFSFSVLNADSIDMVIPTPPKPTNPIKLNIVNGNDDISDRTIKFSKRYPPDYTPLEDRIKEKVGDVDK